MKSSDVQAEETVTIRECEAADRESIIELFRELQEFERAIDRRRLRGEEMAEIYVLSLEEQCIEKSGKMFVAVVENRIVGFVCIFPKELLDEALNERTDVAYISDLVVQSSCRRLGIGKLLMERAEKYAKEQGAEALLLNVLARNQVGRDFYARYGFIDYEMTLLKELRE